MDTKIEYALELLAPEPLCAIKNFGDLETIDEIRLRVNRPISVSIGDKDLLLDTVASAADIEHTFKTAFSYSMHSYSKELAHGYITTKGGNRVGICGTAVTASGRENVDTLKYISSINIRIAREIKGCADTIMKTCFSDELSGVLVVGAPSSGKTTILRDITRQLGTRYKISLIDEQGEISATHRNIAQNDIGALTDVFFGYPKHIGIETAVRVMSPRAVIVDEIGTDDDAKALELALHSGVKLITAVHGASFVEARQKPAVKRLIKQSAFQWVVELCPSREKKVIKLD